MYKYNYELKLSNFPPRTQDLGISLHIQFMMMVGVYDE